MRNSRAFNKRIEIWQTSAYKDTFGGQKIVTYLIGSQWAKIETTEGRIVQSLGLDYTKGTVNITLRERNDIKYNSKTIFIRYRGKDYTIASFPTNDNFKDAFTTFIAVENKVENFITYAPIDAAGIYAVYEARVTSQGGTITSEECCKEWIGKLLGASLNDKFNYILPFKLA